jgi:hypothetical protein
MLFRSRTSLAAWLALWVAGIATGLGALHRYAAAPGPVGEPEVMADELEVHRTPGRPLLVMAVHPLCPCSEASLAELGDFLARSRGRCDALLLQYHPGDDARDWSRDIAMRRLGDAFARVVPDEGGRLATAIGAATSGHVVLIDGEGRVRFRGGITTSRGHRGRAPAQDAMLEVVAGTAARIETAPVFGCTLSASSQ